MTSTSKSFAAALAVLVTATLFATGGAVIKASSLTAWQIAGGRSLVAFLAFIALVPAVRRSWSRVVLLLGVPYAGVMLLFVHANVLASAGSVTLLQATAPLYVALLGPVLIGERPTRRSVLLLPLFGWGVYLLLSAGTSASVMAANPSVGRALAAAAGLCFGLIILGLRAVQRPKIQGGSIRGDGSVTAMQAVACGNLLASLLAAPLMFRDFASSGWQLAWIDAGWVLYLGLFQIGLAYILLVPALERLPAMNVSLLLLAELVLSPAFALWMHGEPLGQRTLAGGLVVLVASAVEISWLKRPRASGA